MDNTATRQPTAQGNHLMRQNPPLRLAPARQNNPGQPLHNQARQNSVQNQQQKSTGQNFRPQNMPPQNKQSQSGQRNPQNRKKTPIFLKNLLPSSIYDPKQKKLFGFLAAEDLLLAALIFLLLEKDDEDNLFMILALLYVLLSEYIEIPGFEF